MCKRESRTAPSPFHEAVGGWILGSDGFAARLRKLAAANASHATLAEARQLAGLDPKRILAAVADFYEVQPASLAKRHEPHIGRERPQPGASAATRRRPWANWQSGWACPEQTVSRTLLVASKRN